MSDVRAATAVRPAEICGGAAAVAVTFGYATDLGRRPVAAATFVGNWTPCGRAGAWSEPR